MHQKERKVIALRKTIFKKFLKTYLHYGKLPKETEFERSIADRVKLRKQKLDIINKNKEKINNELFKEYFNYSNPDTMNRILKDAGDEKNKNMVESINKKLNKMKMCLKIKNLRLKRIKKQLILLKGFLSLIEKNNQGQD